MTFTRTPVLCMQQNMLNQHCPPPSKLESFLSSKLIPVKNPTQHHTGVLFNPTTSPHPQGRPKPNRIMDKLPISMKDTKLYIRLPIVTLSFPKWHNLFGNSTKTRQNIYPQRISRARRATKRPVGLPQLILGPISPVPTKSNLPILHITNNHV